VQAKVLFCHNKDIFEEGSLDSAERVFLDKHCHGLIEWCVLHPRRKENPGLVWIKPRLTSFDHVFISTDLKNSQSYKQIKKLLAQDTIHLSLIKNMSSEKDFSEAKTIFEKVEWITSFSEENVFVGL
jgi:hypothetical protein